MDVAGLFSPPGQSELQGPWLARLARLLRGFRPVPLVLRHQIVTRQGRYQADVEVRRWSEESYLRLSEGKREQHLWLDAAGRVWFSQLQRKRWIRQLESEQIYDEILSLVRIPQPDLDHLELALTRLISQRGALFWQVWERLSPEQHRRLVAVAQTWEVLQPALESSAALAQAALPLLLSPDAHPATRMALLSAGAQGSYAPPAETLPWLLLQVEWNLDPGVLGLARAALQRHPQQAWSLRAHPNPAVRRRLAQLLPARQPWLDWLSQEAEGSVRQTLRLRLEEELPAAQLVEQLTLETDAARRGALGWLLVHWSRPFDSQAELRKAWRRAESALSPPHKELLQKRRRMTPRRRG